MTAIFGVSQNHGLQHVHDLRNVCHYHAVGIFMEDIERQCGYHGIAHGILLIEVSVDSSWFFIPPCSPFVNEQANPLSWIFLVHNGTVFLDDILDFKTFTQSPVIFIVVEVRGRTFRTVPSAACVIVQRYAIHAIANVVHQHLCPIIVVVAGSRSNLVEIVAVVVATINAISTVKVAIIFGAHVSATSPTLVANAEVFHFPCPVTTVLPTQLCHWRIAVRCHVLYPFCQFLYSTRTNVSADIWFATNQFAEVQELMCTKRIVFNRSTPVVVLHLGTFVARTNTVHPVIFIGKATAWPTQYRNLQVFQRL